MDCLLTDAEIETSDSLRRFLFFFWGGGGDFEKPSEFSRIPKFGTKNVCLKIIQLFFDLFNSPAVPETNS